MKRDYRLFIKDIIAVMESIEGFVEGMSFLVWEAIKAEIPSMKLKLQEILTELEGKGEDVSNLL